MANPYSLPAVFGVFAVLAGPPPTELPLFPLVPDLPRPPPLPLDPLAAVEPPLVVVVLPLVAGLVPLVAGLLPLPGLRDWGPVKPLTGALLLLCAGKAPET